MIFLIPLTLFGWFFVVLFLYRHLPPQRALVISFVSAYLFLPVYSYAIPGLPVYGKMSATCYATLFAVLFYDIDRFKAFRPSLVDLPMMFWCSAPFIAAITNDLGAYTGFRSSSETIAIWAIPYLLGRLYLNDLSGLRQLAVGIFSGGLLYAPLCLIEFKMSPFLHARVYGITSNDSAFWQSVRKGGYRPVLFTIHGLSVALWMMAAALIGVWLWQSGSIKRFWNISMKWLVLFLVFVLILIQSIGALMCFVLSLFILYIAKWFRTSVLVLLLSGVISFYLYIATTGSFDGDKIVNFFSLTINPERAGSLEYRLDQEKLLVAKARKRMTFGWAGNGRSRIYDEWGKDLAITDSWWVIVFGTSGIFGLASGTLVLLFPVLLFTHYYPAKTWSHPKVAPAAAISLVLVSFMIDNLVNAITMPVFVLGIGGLSGLLAKHLASDEIGRDGISLSVGELFLPDPLLKSQHYLPSEEGSDGAGGQ
jgi:hypothetical protein